MHSELSYVQFLKYGTIQYMKQIRKSMRPFVKNVSFKYRFSRVIVLYLIKGKIRVAPTIFRVIELPYDWIDNCRGIIAAGGSVSSFINYLDWGFFEPPF